MQAKTKRILYGIFAAMVTAALAIGGTFAWNATEHKSNFVRTDADYQARLVEYFDQNPEWEVGQEIIKKISASNLGNTYQFEKTGVKWGDIYVRIQLKEHLDLTPIVHTYYPEGTDNNTRFMVDKDGFFVRFSATDTATEPNMNSIRNNNLVWEKVITDAAKREAYVAGLQPGDFVKIQSYYDTQPYWYLMTKEGDPNGQYGAFVVIDRFADEASRELICTCPRATDVDYTNYDPAKHPNEECDYNLHVWKAGDPETCALATHDYVDWKLGDSVILLTDWEGKPVDKWILDTTTGWAYWGNALKPGQTTELLLESITPIVQPDGEVFYVIHVDMEAADYKDMLNDNLWDDPWVIGDGMKKTPRARFNPSRLEKDVSDPPFTHGSVPGITTDGTTLTNWRSSNQAIATVDQNGEVTLEGGTGTVTITCTVTPGDGSASYDISYDIVVEDGTPAPLPTLSLPAEVNKAVIDPNFDMKQYLEPAGAYNATDYTITGWTSATTDTATVNNSSGIVSIDDVGTTVITATVTPATGAPYSISTILKVTETRPTLPTLSFPATVSKDLDEDFNAIPLIQGGYNATDFTLSNWTSSNTNVAAVSNGNVDVKSIEGDTDITVTVTPAYGAPPYQITFKLEVADGRAPLAVLAYDPNTKTVDYDDVAQRTFNAKNLLQKAGGGTPDFGDYTITFSSSNTAVATVNSTTGVVTVLKDNPTPINIIANITPSYGASAYNVTLALTVTSGVLPLKNFPAWPTDTDNDLIALGSVSQHKLTNGNPPTLSIYEGMNPHIGPQRGYGYYPLSYFLDSSILESATPVEVVYVSSGVLYSGSDPSRSGTTVGAIPASSITVQYTTPGAYFERRPNMWIDYVNEPCIVLKHSFALSELVDPDKDYMPILEYREGYYWSEMKIQLKQGSKTSATITLPIMIEFQ